MKEEVQTRLFDATTEVDQHWKGMPDFDQKDETSWHSTRVHFENWEDMQAFGDAIGQRLLRKTRSIWFPIAEIGRFAGKAYTDRENIPDDELKKETVDGIIDVRTRFCPVCREQIEAPTSWKANVKCLVCESTYTENTYAERLPKLENE